MQCSSCVLREIYEYYMDIRSFKVTPKGVALAYFNIQGSDFETVASFKYLGQEWANGKFAGIFFFCQPRKFLPQKTLITINYTFSRSATLGLRGAIASLEICPARLEQAMYLFFLLHKKGAVPFQCLFPPHHLTQIRMHDQNAS